MKAAGAARWPWLVLAGALGFGAFEWLRPRAPAGELVAAGTRSLAPAPSPAATTTECPADQLADDGVCIPAPSLDESAAAPAPLELLPGRAADYASYVTPVAAYPAAPAARGLGLFVAAPRGVPVTAINLEAQAGATRRWVTATAPRRLLTLHRVERGGAIRTYVLVYEGLAFEAAPGIIEVDVGTPLGRVAAGPGSTGLGVSVRQLRRGVEPELAHPERLLLDSSSLPCDPRNVLPSRTLPPTPAAPSSH